VSSAGNPTYPVKVIAKLLLLSERRIQQLTKEGVIPKSERGRYELAPAVQGYVRYLQDRMAGAASVSGDIDYHKEKARKTRAEADIAEIEASLRQGRSIDADEVKRGWQLILGEVRANLLGNTPARIAARLVGLKDDAEIRRVIADEIKLSMLAAAETDVEALFNDKGVQPTDD
jgi:phage terminase Nu1 subunit (DNA packaging protein)